MPGSVPEVRVLVPMKPIAEAKSRLWPGVPTGLRQAAALVMLHRVVRTAVGALGPAACTVVGGDELVRRTAEDAGGAWQPERGHDLNSSLWLAMQSAYTEHSAAALFLPADLPQASAEDILGVVAASDGLKRPAAVPAHRDGGTNALLMPSAVAFAPLLGPDSFARHRYAAERQGTPLAAVTAPSLAFDVDSPEDLACARAHVAGFHAELGDWRARLEREYPGLA